jgi:hypothetical protein
MVAGKQVGQAAPLACCQSVKDLMANLTKQNC